MGYANIQADSNFYRQSLNADGVKYVTGPYTSLYEDVFRAVTVTTDSVVSVTSYVGDSLSSQFLLAGTEIYGLFSSVTIHSGSAVLHLAGASYISEIINQYSATGIPLGFYEEGTQCLSQKISALLTQGIFDDASWVMVPSQYKEDTVRAFKPTSELGNLAFTRSSDATFTDSTGVVRRSPWNLVQQSEMFSDASWSKTTGVVVTPNAILAPNGTLTADYIQMGGANRAVAQATSLRIGVSCTSSIYIKGTSGETIAIAAGGADSPLITLTGEWQRITYTATSIQSWINVNTFNGATARNFYLWGAQLVEGSEALPYFATTDRLNVPRLDYRNADGTLSTCPRLLLEPQRTNSIRNSSMVGAVAGSPGTIPTNWAVNNLSGLTQTIVGTGVENGLPYFDIRYNGTATSTSSIDVRDEASTQIAASNGQSWTHTAYLRLVSAVVPPASVQIGIYERTSAGIFVVGGLANAAITSTLQRFSLNRTLSGGETVAFTQPLIQFSVNNATAYDFTIRIAAPQMELGAYATTWVPTTTTAVTRILDDARKSDVSSLINETEGTLYCEFNIGSDTFDGDLISVNGGTSANGFFVSFRNSKVVQLIVRTSNTNALIFQRIGTYAIGTNKIAVAYKNGDFAISLNGTAAQVNTSTITMPTGINSIRISSVLYGSPMPVGHSQSAIFPVRLDNATLAALTTL